MSKVPPSIEAAFTSTSGGWITGPALVSATSSASTHGRVAGNSALMRSSATFEREAGNTPTGRLAARTGARHAGRPGLAREIRQRAALGEGERQRPAGARQVAGDGVGSRTSPA